MIATTIWKMRGLATPPISEQWELRLKRLQKVSNETLGSDAITYEDILQETNLSFTMRCAHLEPQFERHWRLFSLRCLEPLRTWVTDHDSRRALRTLDSFVAGQFLADNHDGWSWQSIHETAARGSTRIRGKRDRMLSEGWLMHEVMACTRAHDAIEAATGAITGSIDHNALDRCSQICAQAIADTSKDQETGNLVRLQFQSERDEAKRAIYANQAELLSRILAGKDLPDQYQTRQRNPRQQQG